MTAPDTAIFQEHPDFAAGVMKMLRKAETSLKSLQEQAQGPMALGVLHGYDTEA